MNCKSEKAIRRSVNKRKKLILRESMREMMTSPLRLRIAFAWMVVWGVRKPQP